MGNLHCLRACRADGLASPLNHNDLQFPGYVVVDGIEEFPKLDAVMSSVMLRNDPSALDVERREERSISMTDVLLLSENGRRCDTVSLTWVRTLSLYPMVS